MDAEGIWVVTEDISYSAVVANPSDAATAKLEKLKVNDTTYANWTENEIKSIASESGGGKLYQHNMSIHFGDSTKRYAISFPVHSTTSEEANTISKFKNLYGDRTPTSLIMATDKNTAAGVGFLKNLINDSSKPQLIGYLGSWTPVDKIFPNIDIFDYVTEL